MVHQEEKFNEDKTLTNNKNEKIGLIIVLAIVVMFLLTLFNNFILLAITLPLLFIIVTFLIIKHSNPNGGFVVKAENFKEYMIKLIFIIVEFFKTRILTNILLLVIACILLTISCNITKLIKNTDAIESRLYGIEDNTYTMMRSEY